MAAEAGATIIAGKIPGERIATTIATSNSGTITTTETTVMSVTAPVVAGRTYRVRAEFTYQQSVATDLFFARIEEDSPSGTQLQGARFGSGSTSTVFHESIEAEYTADATEDKTFVLDFQRASGTGNIILNVGASQPGYLYVDYIRG